MVIRRLEKPDRFARPQQRVDYTTLTHAKNPPVADARFKAFARKRGCAVAGLIDKRTGGTHRCERIEGRIVIEFAHYRTAGKGLKGSDHGNGMGLCHQMHRLQHDLGWPRFSRNFFNFKPEETCREIAERYDATLSKEQVSK